MNNTLSLALSLPINNTHTHSLSRTNKQHTLSQAYSLEQALELQQRMHELQLFGVEGNGSVAAVGSWAAEDLTRSTTVCVGVCVY